MLNCLKSYRKLTKSSTVYQLFSSLFQRDVAKHFHSIVADEPAAHPDHAATSLMQPG